MTDWAAEGLLEGVEGEQTRADRIELLEYLAREGFQLEEIKAACKQGRLGLLPLDRALEGEEARYSARDVSEETGLSLDLLRQLWRALGFADPDDDEIAYTAEDIEHARTVAAFRDAGLDEEALILISRVLGQSMAYLAETLREVAGEALLQAGDTEMTAGLRWAEAAKYLVPQLTPVLGYLLSMRLREQLKNALILEAELETGRTQARDITVCFADLVGFTKMGERVPPGELAAAARDLNGLAIEAARPPVRLVKMIGDAAMLVSEEPRPLVEAALQLAEAEPGAPLRVGIAAGAAVRHVGDWVGAPVNLASRVTGVAKPGSVLATREVRDLVREEFEWSNAGSRRLKGVRDPVRLYRVRAKDETPG